MQAKLRSNNLGKLGLADSLFDRWRFRWCGGCGGTRRGRLLGDRRLRRASLLSAVRAGSGSTEPSSSSGDLVEPSTSAPLEPSSAASFVVGVSDGVAASPAGVASVVSGYFGSLIEVEGKLQVL